MFSELQNNIVEEDKIKLNKLNNNKLKKLNLEHF